MARRRIQTGDRSMRWILAVAAAGGLACSPVFAKGGHRGGGGHGTSISHSSHTATHSARSRSADVSHFSSSKHTAHYARGVARDKNGRIARSEHAKSEFKKTHPCPSTGKSSGACPGYVIAHVTA